MGSDNSNINELTVTRRELLRNGSDAEFRNLIHGLLAYASYVDVCRTQFGAQLGITGTQYEVLIRLQRLQGKDGASIGEIARSLHKTGALITIEAGALNLKNLVEKFGDPNDGRRVLLRLTPKGEKALARLVPFQQKINDMLFDDVSSEDFDAMCHLFEKLQPNGQRALDLMTYLKNSDQSVEKSSAA